MEEVNVIVEAVDAGHTATEAVESSTDNIKETELRELFYATKDLLKGYRCETKQLFDVLIYFLSSPTTKIKWWKPVELKYPSINWDGVKYLTREKVKPEWLGSKVEKKIGIRNISCIGPVNTEKNKTVICSPDDVFHVLYFYKEHILRDEISKTSHVQKFLKSKGWGFMTTEIIFTFCLVMGKNIVKNGKDNNTSNVCASKNKSLIIENENLKKVNKTLTIRVKFLKKLVTSCKKHKIRRYGFIRYF